LKTRFIVFFLTATQCFLAGCNPRNTPQRREPQDTFPTEQQPRPTSRDNEGDRGNDNERDRGNDTDRNRDRDLDRNDRDNDNDRERDNNRGGENRNRQKKYGANNLEINQVHVRQHQMKVMRFK
jgi:hypothetical protein